MDKYQSDNFEIDGAYGLIITSLIVKLYWLQPDLGLFSPAEKVFAVFIRNRMTALCCHLVFGLFLLSLTSLIFRTRNTRLVVAVLLQLVLIPLAYIDLTYARFQGSFISSSQLSLWREGVSSFGTLRSYVARSDLLLLADLPIALAAYYLAYTVRCLRTKRRKVLLTAFLSGFCLFGLSLHLWFKCSSPDVLARPYNRRFTSPMIWLINGIRHTLPCERYALPDIVPDELTYIESEKTRRLQVVFLQVESLQAGVIEWVYQGQRVMPFLYGLSQKYPYSSSAISPRRAGVSFDADIAVLTGFQPPETSDPYSYGFGNPPYFPHLLSRRGYETVTWDNYLPEFYRGKKNHDLLGIRTYHSLRDRKWTTSLPRLSANCPGDNEFLRAAAQDIVHTSTPTFFHVKTLSSHGPWNGLGEQVEVINLVGRPFGKGKDVLDGYAAIMRYMDRSIEAFFNELKPLLEKNELLLALFGDHGAGLPIPTPTVRTMTVKEVREKCVPLLLIGFDSTSLDGPVALSNLPATVASQIQLPYTKGDLGGRNLFDSAAEKASDDALILAYGFGKLGAPK